MMSLTCYIPNMRSPSLPADPHLNLKQCIKHCQSISSVAKDVDGRYLAGQQTQRLKG